MKRRWAFPLAAVVSLGAGCKGKEAEGPAVATVNGRGIPVEQFQATYAQFLQQGNVRFNSETEAKSRVLETMVDRELMVQEAIAQGIDRQPEIVKQMDVEIRNAERKIREEYMIQNYLRTRMGGNPNLFRPTEQDVSAFYQLYHALPFNDPNAKAWKGPEGQQNAAAAYLLYDQQRRRVRSYPEAHDAIAQHLGIQKQTGMLQSVIRSLKEKAKIEVDNGALASVRLPSAGGPGGPGGPGRASGGVGGVSSAANPPELPVEVGSGPVRMQTASAMQANQKAGGAPPPGSMPPPKPKS